MQQFRRILAALACMVVGVASFSISYVALRDVSVAVQAVPEYLGWLVPVVIDGGIICGSAVIWSLSKEQDQRPTFPFLFVGSLVLVSVVVNVNHAGPSLLAKGIASLPPLILLGTLELVAAQSRRMTSETAATPEVPLTEASGPPVEPAPPVEVTSSAPAASPVELPAQRPAPLVLTESVPSAPAPAFEPAPEPVQVTAPPAPVPAPPVSEVPDAPVALEAPEVLEVLEVLEVTPVRAAPARAAAKTSRTAATPRPRAAKATSSTAGATEAPAAKPTRTRTKAVSAPLDPTTPEAPAPESLEPATRTTSRSGVARKAPRVRATPAALDLVPEA